MTRAVVVRIDGLGAGAVLGGGADGNPRGDGGVTALADAVSPPADRGVVLQAERIAGEVVADRGVVAELALLCFHPEVGRVVAGGRVFAECPAMTSRCPAGVGPRRLDLGRIVVVPEGRPIVEGGGVRAVAVAVLAVHGGPAPVGAVPAMAADGGAALRPARPGEALPAACRQGDGAVEMVGTRSLDGRAVGGGR